MSQPEHARQIVTRRHVYFLAGFDPKGASYYHALYQKQSQEQSAINSISMQVSARQRDASGVVTWQVRALEPDGSNCDTTYEFCRWDDIVRQHWPRSTWQLLKDMLIAYRDMFASGEIGTVWRLSRKTLVGLAYPLAVLGGGVLLGLAAAMSMVYTVIGSGVSWLVASFAALLAFSAVLWLTARVEKKLNSTWLARIFSFSGKQAKGELPELDARMNTLAAAINTKIQASDVDEILVVGFSVGSILAVSTLARAFALGTDRANRKTPTVSLMTLGHCIPMLGLSPHAEEFRAELGELARCQALYWVDFSSPTDWGSFALVDPVDACRIKLVANEKFNPVMRSPRFHTVFNPADYARIRRDKRRMHLQYLMAGKIPSSYDYFAITAGTRSLHDRHRPHSVPADR